MTFPLRPFQAEDVAALPLAPKAALWWDPGLGKTLASIAAITNAGVPSEQVCVICPAHLILTWRAEWEKWLPGHVCPLILSYVMAARRNVDLWKRMRFIVVDEAHYLKSLDSKRSLSLVPKLHACPHVLLLSGTPAPNGRPIELYLTATIVCPDRLQSVAGCPRTNALSFYTKTFCGHGMYPGDTKGTRPEGLPLLRECFKGRAFSRTKAACLPELPPKVYRTILLPSCALVAEAEKDLKQRVHDAHGAGPDVSPEWLDGIDPAGLLQMLAATPEGLGAYGNLLRLFAEAKAADAAAYVADCVRDGETRIVVFGRHRGLLSAIGAAVVQAGGVVDYLWGGVDQEDRQAAVNRFQKPVAGSRTCHVLCCNFTAAGVGYTFTAATHVILAELPWTPGEVDQATDRLHRIGQTGSVLVDMLCVEGTLDNWAARKIETKAARVSELLS